MGYITKYAYQILRKSKFSETLSVYISELIVVWVCNFFNLIEQFW